MDMELLISCVFAKNPLWDQNDDNHHNRFILDKLWDEVASEMKSTRNVVRAKWKTLRDTFRKELRKIPRKRSGDQASQSTWQSSWQYFGCLHFLRDQFTIHSSSGNLPSDYHDGTAQENNVNYEVSACSKLSDLDDSINVDQPPLHASKTSKRKHPIDENIGIALIQLEESKLRILKNQHQNAHDEDDSFFCSLLPHIRPLPPPKKMLLRMKILELVYGFVYGNQHTAYEGHDPFHGTNSSPHMESQLCSNPISVASYCTTACDDNCHE